MRFWEPCVGRWDWVSAMEEVPVSGMALGKSGPTWMWPWSRGLLLRLHLPGSVCSSHPTFKHSLLSRAWACSQHSFYTPQPGMWCSGGPGLRLAFTRRSWWEGSAHSSYMGTAASPGQGTHWPGLEGMGPEAGPLCSPHVFFRGL